MGYLGSSEVAFMVSDGRKIARLLVVLAVLCLVGLYWPAEAVLVGVVPIGYIHWVEFQQFHTTPEANNISNFWTSLHIDWQIPFLTVWVVSLMCCCGCVLQAVYIFTSRIASANINPCPACWHIGSMLVVWRSGTIVLEAFLVFGLAETWFTYAARCVASRPCQKENWQPPSLKKFLLTSS